MRIHAIASLVLALVATVAAPAEEPREILFYGNSFTIGIGSNEAVSFGGVPEVVRQLAIADGHPAPRVENAAVSGQSLAWHLANNTNVIANPVDFLEVPDFEWDIVVLQEFSTNPTHIGNPAAFRADAATMFDNVRGHSPNVRAVLYETWARGPGHSYYTGNPPAFPGGPAEMQQELRDNYELCRQDFVAAYGADAVQVGRVGDAWEATGWDDLHGTDIYHANTRGTYLAGLVLYGTIYGERTTVGLPKLFASLSAQEAADLQAIADAYLPAGEPFDGDNDRDVDADDLGAFVGCMAGPDLPLPGGPTCSVMDGDADGDADLADFATMQGSILLLPAQLCFDPPDLSVTLPEGAGSSPQNILLTVDDGSSPTVALAAVDLDTQAGPTWLSVPASATGGTTVPVSLNATGLGAGTYFARVNATSAGYESGTFTVTLLVTSATQDIWVDFGSDATPTTGGATYWNNVTTGSMTTPVALFDAGSLPTGATLAFDPNMALNGSNTNGTQSPAPGSDMAALNLPVTATQDSLFGNDVQFSAGIFPQARIVLSGLNPSALYDFTFIASRMGVGDARTTDYAVAGATTTTVTLNAANNDADVITAVGIAPDAQHEIVITINKSASNNNSFGFYYIGALRIEADVP